MTPAELAAAKEKQAAKRAQSPGGKGKGKGGADVTPAHPGQRNSSSERKKNNEEPVPGARAAGIKHCHSFARDGICAAQANSHECKFDHLTKNAVEQMMRKKKGSGGGDAAAAAVDDGEPNYHAVYDGVYDEYGE